MYFENNKTLIHVAAEYGQLHCLQKLINIWPRDYVNMVDSKNRTALHLAAMNGHRYFPLGYFIIIIYYYLFIHNIHSAVYKQIQY